MNLSRKQLIVLCSLTLLAIGAIIISVIYYRRQQPGYTEVRVDPDTGETILNQPNVTPEKFNAQSDVIVLGLAELNKFGVAGLVPNQIPTFRDDLLTRALPSLGPHDKTIKIIDVSYNQSNDKTYATLKLSESRFMRVVITVASVEQFSYEIKDGSKQRYQSRPLFTYSDDDEYGGDGVSPEQQPADDHGHDH